MKALISYLAPPRTEDIVKAIFFLSFQIFLFFNILIFKFICILQLDFQMQELNKKTWNIENGGKKNGKHLITRDKWASKSNGSSYTGSNFLGCQLKQPSSYHYIHASFNQGQRSLIWFFKFSPVMLILYWWRTKAYQGLRGGR